MSERFKVWLEVERIIPDCNGDCDYERIGEPEELGCFDTLEDAEAFSSEVIGFRPDQLHALLAAAKNVIICMAVNDGASLANAAQALEDAVMAVGPID